MNDAQELLAAYFRLMNVNGAAHVYREAVRSGLLDALAPGPKEIDALARSCALVPGPVALLLDVLVSLALVRRSGAAYELTMLAQMLLAGGYRNLGDSYWAHLPALLQTGRPLVQMDDRTQSEAHYQAQAAVLGWMLKPAAECAAALLTATLPADAAILDLGAGSAVWSLALAAQSPARTVTAVDWPAVLEVAREAASELGLEERLQTIAGDFHEVALPEGRFNLAIVANVAHLLTPEGNAALFKKARRALRPGGRIAVIDVLPGQPEGDLNRTLYTLGLALRTEHARVYSASDLEPLLEAAGFGPAQLVPLRVPPYALGMLLAAAA